MVSFSDPVTGQVNLDVLPYIERVRAAAPADTRGALDVVIAWLGRVHHRLSPPR